MVPKWGAVVVSNRRGLFFSSCKMSGPALNRKPGEKPACGLNTGDPEAGLVAGLGDVARQVYEVLKQLFDDRLVPIIADARQELVNKGYSLEAVDELLEGRGSSVLREEDAEFGNAVIRRVKVAREQHNKFVSFVKREFARALEAKNEATPSASLAPEDLPRSPEILFKEWIQPGQKGPAPSERLQGQFELYLISPGFFEDDPS